MQDILTLLSGNSKQLFL